MIKQEINKIKYIAEEILDIPFGSSRLKKPGPRAYNFTRS